MGFDPYNPVPVHDEVAIKVYLRRESEFMADRGYSNLPENNRRRQIALHRTLQETLQYSRSEDFDSFIPYLAMNYFDRFVSRKGLPNIEEDWIDDTDIVATSCLWFSWKMRTEYFNFSSFLSEKQISHKKEKIEQAEQRIFEALDGQMGPVTALCFAPFLIDVCEPREGIRGQTICQIVLETQDDIRFTAFKPSVISASAILTALSYLYRKHYRFYENKLMSLEFIDKEEVIQCMPLMREMCAMKQLWMETVETDLRGRPLVQVQAKSSPPLTTLQPLPDTTLAMRTAESSPKTQPRKEPEQDEEPGAVPEIQQVDEPPTMDFDLKWIIDNEVGSLLSPEHGTPFQFFGSNADQCTCTVL